MRKRQTIICETLIMIIVNTGVNLHEMSKCLITLGLPLILLSIRFIALIRECEWNNDGAFVQRSVV
jgi:hypothetical protein